MRLRRRDLLKLGIAGAAGGSLIREPAHAVVRVPLPVGPTPVGVVTPPNYPQSAATRGPIDQMLDALFQNRAQAARFYLDTTEEQSLGFLGLSGGENHHQGLARTHRLSDGSVYFFLTQSDVDSRHGQLMQFRYGGPLNGSHVLETRPLTVASLVELIHLQEQHPSDLAFLSDVGGSDSGYLFVTEEYDQKRLMAYYWARGANLQPLGSLDPQLPGDHPKFVFLDLSDDTYYLAVHNDSWVRLYTARAERLFPVYAAGHLDLTAFAPAGLFPMQNMQGACQVKLIRDSLGRWYLLGFRSDPSDDPNGTDYVDVYRIQFSPFAISPRLYSKHIAFPSGDTGFANTGTHYVEPTGRLLLSSSYRWSEDEGPGNSGYVSRVDECPSS